VIRSLDWDGSAIVAIDQTLLPHEERLIRLDTIPALAEAIRSLRIRGAPALGVAGALGLALAVRTAQRERSDVRAAIDEAAHALATTRPTAVNLRWGIDKARAAFSGGADAVVTCAVGLLEADVRTNRRLAERGADWLDSIQPKREHPLRILTHCNTGALACVEKGTALGIIEVAHSRGAVKEVFATETRPLLQGARLTAWELQRSNIPYRLVADGAAPALIARGLVDVVIVGADRIAVNGDVANKVGTYALALAAKRAGIPLIVAAPESTMDNSLPSGEHIPIEERPEAEVLGFGAVRVAPLGAHAVNPAFDVTPADLVTAIVTEARVIEHR
jgi:methylthioribose-1-phosphate isomerase